MHFRTQSKQGEDCEHVVFLRANNESRRRDGQAAAGRRGAGSKWSRNEFLGSQTTRTHTRGLTKTDLLALSWQRRWIPYSFRTRPWNSTLEVQQQSSSHCICFIAGLTSSPPPFISLPFVQTLPLPSPRGRHRRTHPSRPPTLLLQHLQHHRR